MTVLVFLLAVAAIVAVVLAIESRDDDTQVARQPIGLLTWLTRGNWPTKVGGALIVVGVGALLRYAALNLEVPPPFKLVAGVLIAGALGFISVSLPAVAARRSVSLALAGSAFGVAYLTAYSAFALFGYLDNPEGLALLGVTSVATAAYAVSRGAMSLAVLSMLGAFLAPAFAIADPGAAVVYGYYVGASLLTLVLVLLRGWHPLIHLSFLFTLGGGVFFAWTAKYYTGADAGVMLPMLLLLSAIHVAMPILEKSTPRASWTTQADLIYTIALPSVAAMLAVLLAANRPDLATALVVLGVIWGVAALGYLATRKEGVAAHATIAALLVMLGVATQFRDLPWELIALAFSVVGLAVAVRVRQPADRLHNLLAGLVLVFGAIHILTSTASRSIGPPFLHAVFIERIVGATLLVWAGILCRRIRQPLDTLLLVAGCAWAFVALGIEALRYDLATFALLAHWGTVLLSVSLWLPGRKLRGLDRHAGWLAGLVALTAVWAVAGNLSGAVVWISLVAASLALVGLAVRPVTTDDDTAERRLAAALLAPATAAIWATKAGALAGIEHHQFGLCVAVLVAIAALAVGARARGTRGAWVDVASDIGAVAFAVVLTIATLFDIARNPWAIGLELLCLTGLGLITWIRAGLRRPTETLVIALVLCIALVVQANLLRLLGPPGDLDIGDILHLRFSAVLSLLWAIVGSALTIWSRRASSRALWFAGAGLLVAAAVKLLIVDFGSLGQLANILAVIAAGAVFLLVGWLVPIPPSRSSSAPADAPQEERLGNDVAEAAASSGEPDDHKKTAWTVAVVLSLIGLLFSSQGKLLDPWREWYGHAFENVGQRKSGGETSGARSQAMATVSRGVAPGVTSRAQTATEALESGGAADESSEEPGQDSVFDPAQGVLGLRWGTPIDDVRRAFPSDTRLGDDKSKLWYNGPLQVESMTLPKAVVIFAFDRAGLASASIVTGADEGPALARIFEARLGNARYGRQPREGLYQHVLEWSTARYGVRLQFISNSDDRAASGRPVDSTEIEIQPSPLSTNLIETIERPEPPRPTTASTKEYPPVSSTWGDRLNPNNNAPMGRFSAYYLRSGEPPQLIARDSVDDVSINYAWADFHGIKSEDFEGYWVGRFRYEKETPVYLTVDQSWSQTRVIVDRKLIYEGGSNARVPFVFSPGTHTVEVEYANNWHTTSLSVNFVGAEEPLPRSELRARLRALAPEDAVVQFAAVYESGAQDNVVVLNLAPSRVPVILVLNSYSSVHWVIKNPNRVDLRAVVYGGHAPGSRIQTDKKDDGVPRLLVEGALGSYDASPRCRCVGGLFHCEGGSLLDTVQSLSAMLGYSVAGVSGEYSPKAMNVPSIVVTPEVVADARSALERIGNARRECEKTRELHR